MRKVFFAGSFNPFTPGHANIVERGLALFDGIVIGLGCNMDKPENKLRAEANMHAIKERYAGCESVEVVMYDGLTVDAAHAHGCCCLLRGIRSITDYEYEMNMADVNRKLSGIDTVVLFSLPELACWSSSIVRELAHYGRSLPDKQD